VIINQKQTTDKLFKLPLDIDLYTGNSKKRYSVWAENKIDTFSFSADVKPDWIDVDPDKLTLWQKKDNKPTEAFILEYKVGKTLVDRREAINYCADHKQEPAAFALLKDALTDRHYTLRLRTLGKLMDTTLDASTLAIIEKLAKNDAKSTVRAAAIDLLAKTKDAKYLPLYVASVKDSSYSVAGASLEAIASLDEEKAIALLPELKKDNKGRLKNAVKEVDVLTKGDKDFDEMTKEFTGVKRPQEKFNLLGGYIDFLGRVNNTENFKKGLDEVVAFRESVAQYGVAPRINEMITDMAKKKEAAKAKGANAVDIDTQLAYIKEKTKE
jgi:aminopeptidase N